MPLRRVCLLSGSSPSGTRPEYAEAALEVARLLAEHGITVVYDGGATGLPGPTADLADGFLALPGGLETLAELFEMLGRAGAAEKPCGLLNTGDYFTSLLRSEGDEVLTRFVRESQRGMLIVDRDAGALLRAMADYRPPETRRLEPREE
ncbi:MAG TPA: LOG family protein [Gemmatimonadales bacterium]|nr:LOG family protein [Gemmatimonadales bacterium]